MAEMRVSAALIVLFALLTTMNGEKPYSFETTPGKLRTRSKICSSNATRSGYCEYFDSGTRLAWVIDPPTRTLAIYHAPGEPTRILRESDQLDGEQVVPGFTISVAELFCNVPATA